MTKPTPESQTAFSFLDEVEKTEPLPKPKRNTLRPPVQVEAGEELPGSSKPEIQNLGNTQETLAKEAAPDTVNELPAPEMEPVFEPASTVSEQMVAEEVEPNAVVEENEEAPVVAAKINEEVDAVNILHPENGPMEEASIDKKPPGTRGRRSSKEHSLAADLVEIPDDEQLFEKQYYSMGEVTAMFKENHSLIRYWESEFDILKPRKNGKGDRFFRPVDVKNLYLIYDLLRRRKFTIDGAREYIKNNKKAEEKFAAVQSLQKIKNFFLEIKANL